MPQYTRPIQNVIDGFSSLPGIGSRSAERIAFHLLKLPTDEAMKLARAIDELKTRVTHCRVCSNLAEKGHDEQRPLCDICDDTRRDRSMVCVVEQPKDLLALESTGLWNGLYHVLLGRIAPLDGIDHEDLTLRDLEERLAAGEIAELVLGTNPNLDGDSTSLYIQELIRTSYPSVKVTRLARGLASGTQIEYANRSVLEDAIKGRQTLR
jgi:recombination protein RecR